MDKDFINILQKLVSEQGKGALTDAKKCKAFLADYTRGEYKKESRLVTQSAPAGMKGDDAFEEGKNFFENGEYDKAVKSLTEAINLGCADMGFAYGVRALAYDRKGQYDQAISDYTMSISLDPNEDIPYLCRGNIYYSKGQHDQAISDYTMAISSLNPNNAKNKKWLANAYTCRGDAYSAIGQHDQAISDYTMAIRLDPNSSRRAAFDRQ